MRKYHYIILTVAFVLSCVVNYQRTKGHAPYYCLYTYLETNDYDGYLALSRAACYVSASECSTSANLVKSETVVDPEMILYAECEPSHRVFCYDLIDDYLYKDTFCWATYWDCFYQAEVELGSPPCYMKP